MDVENDTNEEVEYTNPAGDCLPLAAGASEPISVGKVEFYSKGSGDCDGRLLAEAEVLRGQSVRLTYAAEKFS